MIGPYNSRSSIFGEVSGNLLVVTKGAAYHPLDGKKDLINGLIGPIVVGNR
jgi:hypothetical protein